MCVFRLLLWPAPGCLPNATKSFGGLCGNLLVAHAQIAEGDIEGAAEEEVAERDIEGAAAGAEQEPSSSTCKLKQREKEEQPNKPDHL